MEFAINLLEEHKKAIDKSIKSTNLMQKDISKASQELSKISQLKKAIKVLKLRSKK